MKHTKILATYGPSIESPELLKQLIASGVNAFRVNCSHGTTPDFVKAAATIRAASADSEFPIGLLFDISGPKLRLSRFDGEIALGIGDEIRFSASRTDTSRGVVGVNHPTVLSSVKIGERLFVDDGNMIFEIKSADGTEVVAIATNAGTLLPGKGINLPDTDIQIPTITDKDKIDLRTAVEVGADFVALSFVRSGDDIIEARRLLKDFGGTQRIIAKLEKREAIENLDDIMLLADGVMIARGDLGVELPPAELPKLQKRIIRLARNHQRPVIVATQMLESMRFSPRATRAEINDVAGAVFDNVDAVMLSAETATGSYPLEAVRTMTATIDVSEDGCERPRVELDEVMISSPIPRTIAGAVTSTEHLCETKATFVLTATGYTAGLISGLFPAHPIIALTSNAETLNRFVLFRSVYSVIIEQPTTFDEMLTTINEVSSRYNVAARDDKVTVTGGLPIGSGAPTNFMMIHIVE
jgi:pyruvate kinase